VKIATGFEFEHTKNESGRTDGRELVIRNCHWCGEKLEGLLAEFVHCVKCNERRIIEGITHTFDPCPICMTLKSKKLDFLNPYSKNNGDAPHD